MPTRSPISSSSSSHVGGGPGRDADAIAVFDPLCSVFRRKLKAEGLKYTPERAQVLDTVIRLHDESGMFEADRVLEQVKRSGFRVSKATVYRTIRLMQEAGIVQRVPFDDDQSHFQLVFGGKGHDLLIRLDNGQAMAIDVPELAGWCAAACERLGLTLRGHRLQVFATGPEAPTK